MQNCVASVTSMDKGLPVPKWMLIVWPEIPQMSLNLSAQFVWYFNENRLHWASVVYGQSPNVSATVDFFFVKWESKITLSRFHVCYFLQKRSTNLAVLKGFCKKPISHYCYFTDLACFIFMWTLVLYVGNNINDKKLLKSMAWACFSIRARVVDRCDPQVCASALIVS